MRMENTRGGWILYVIVLSLNFLIAEEKVVVAKTHWIMEDVRLNQTI